MTVGSAKLGEKEIAHEAVPAEDRMQAFLWRHLVPASDLKVLVFDSTYERERHPRHACAQRRDLAAGQKVEFSGLGLNHVMNGLRPR